MASPADSFQPQYILVDGSSYLFRAFHAMPPLTTSSGQPTGAIRGVINMLRKLIKDFPGSQVVVVFDAKGKTFRHDRFAEYKANRPSMPTELAQQIEPIHKIIQTMGLPLLIEPGVEADDVIGTLSTQGAAKNINVLISTGDKDMAQLVNDHVVLMNTMTDEWLDTDGVKEKFGVPPERIIDYLSLMGDKVDNIPGVEKCGPKTAVKWLNAYDSLDGVIENADKVGGKVGENLRFALEQLPLSYELATIVTELELDYQLTELKDESQDDAQLKQWFEDLEFKSWIKEFDGSGKSQSASNKSEKPKAEKVDSVYKNIFTEKEFSSLLDELKKVDAFVFDLETTSLDVRDAHIVGIALCYKQGEAFYIPVAHDYLGAPEQLDRNTVLEQLKPIIENKTQLKIGQNLKYDCNVLLNYDIKVDGIGFDTMLESYVLNSTATRHDMDSLAKFYLDYDTTHFETIAGKGKNQLTFNQIAIEEAGKYAAEDADVTWRLHQHLWPQIQADGLEDIFSNIELPLLSVIADIEAEGVLVDATLLNQQSQELADALHSIEQKAFELAGEEFNLSSPKQLADILFSEQKLNLPIVKKTAKGAPSTAEEVLQELALDYPLPKILLNYRSLSKLKSTYTDKLPKMIHSNTKRIHTSYHQAVVATGRLSSSNPNLQNIPIKTEEGRRIRQAFVAPDGYKIMAADYSQVELRIMAHLSDDASLIDAFAKGADIHSATATEIYGTTIDAVDSEMRRSAKAINFGLIYGMSAFGLAKQLHISRNDAQQYIDLYFERYPGVQEYMDRIRAQATERGYVETVMGRRLYLPDLHASNKMRQQGALRAAINAPMQGTAADIIKIAMINVQQYLQNKDVDARMIMQVHDELVFEVAEDSAQTIQQEICDIMESAASLKVPLVVEAACGNNWDEAH